MSPTHPSNTRSSARCCRLLSVQPSVPCRLSLPFSLLLWRPQIKRNVTFWKDHTVVLGRVMCWSDVVQHKRCLLVVWWCRKWYSGYRPRAADVRWGIWKNMKIKKGCSNVDIETTVALLLLAESHKERLVGAVHWLYANDDKDEWQAIKKCRAQSAASYVSNFAQATTLSFFIK